MTSHDRRWDELQARWARGEGLSADEERERLAYAARDPLARRELEIFAELRARGERRDDPPPTALIERVLEAVTARPQLRLVAPGESYAPASSATPRRKTPRSMVLLAATLALAAGIVLAFQTLRSAAPPPVARSSGAERPAVPEQRARSELVLSAGEVSLPEGVPSTGQGALVQGQRVNTGDGRACLTIDVAIDVCLAEHSAIVLESLDPRSVRVRVETGTALAALSRREPGSSFSLVVADVSAMARGTIFAVRRSGDGSEVLVVEGAVEVARAAAAGGERLEAHSRLIASASSGTLDQAPMDGEEEARLLALRSPHRLWTGDAVGVLELTAGTAPGIRVSIDDQAPLALPLRARVRAGKRRVVWGDAQGGETTSWIDVPVGETRRVEAPVIAPKTAASAARFEKVVSPAALLATARREVARGHLREGIALYEKLRATHPASAEARTVLVTLGKLELDLGRPERALGRFETYLRDGGALAPEALAGKVRALRALRRPAEERRAIQQYLARHPNGFQAPVFEERLKELGPP